MKHPCLAGAKAVSYTHLDVYKRQELDHDLLEEVKRDYLDAFKAAMDTDDKTVRDARLLLSLIHILPAA